MIFPLRWCHSQRKFFNHIFYISKERKHVCFHLIFPALFLTDVLQAAVSIAQQDTASRIKDYHMYISGERLEAYQGIVGWFTTPITTLVLLIIPLMFCRVGFTSDRDVFYMRNVTVQCMLIGIGFDLLVYCCCYSGT